MDVFNSLDLTKHFFTVPTSDAFQEIRIPVWCLRGTYLIPNRFIEDLTVEGVFNPGDQVHTLLPAQGSPYNVLPYYLYGSNSSKDRVLNGYPFFYTGPPVSLQGSEEERHGELSGGGRMYGRVGNLNFTLNYLYTYNQDPVVVTKGIYIDPYHGAYLFGPFAPPLGVIGDFKHPKINIYGASFNYAIDALNAVVRGEAVYIPDQPYQNATTQGASIIRKDTVKYVLGFDRPTFFLPTSLAPHAANLGLQFFQTIYSGHHKLWIYNAPVDRTDNTATVYISQPFYHDQLYVDWFFGYDFMDCYWGQPGVRYEPGNKWRFAVYGNFLGGYDKRAYKFGAFDFTDGVLFRIQYQFN